MDTVEGNKGGKVFLTIIIRDTKFMFIRLLNNKNVASVYSNGVITIDGLTGDDAESGIVIGKQLTITVETVQQPLKINTINQMLKLFK